MTYWPYNNVKQYYDVHYKRYDPKHKRTLRHFRRNKHHYKFIALSIILGALSAIALTLSQH